jgi:hypothetical protein
MSTAHIVNYEPSSLPAAAAAWPKAAVDRASPWGPLIAFLLGLGARLQVKFIGYLPLSEIAIILATPLLFAYYGRADVRRRSGWLVPLLFLWVVGAITSDIYRQTDWSLAARGLGRLVVYITAVPFFSWFLAKDMYRKLMYFAAGIVPSGILSAYVLRGGVHEGRELVFGKAEITWKTHWAFVLLLFGLFLALYLYRRSRIAAYGSSALIGAANLILGSRSTGAMTLLAVPASILKNWFLEPRPGRRYRAKLSRSLVVAGLVAAASFGLFAVYARLAESGRLGMDEQDKYLDESENKYGVLGAGRLVYVVGGLVAVADSPFFGYGSWPLDKYGFYYRVCEIFDMKPRADYYARGYPLIPSHSHIIASMVEHGILAAPFWLYAIFVSVRVILRPIADSKRLQLWVLTTAIAMVWNILFSPISYRMESSMVLVVFIDQYIDWIRGCAAAGPIRKSPVELQAVTSPAAAV